ncbi:hypothetical protein [Rhodococcus jostii]|uniref:hypothetical protein n=1 Tax=Rhodococcus jostii TaxID=132919 RepID=UPI0036493DB3
MGRDRSIGRGAVSFYVNPEALESLSQLRAEAAIVLEGVGSLAPVAIEGGDATAALTGIFGRLAENAGNLVSELDRAGTARRDAMEP